MLRRLAQGNRPEPGAVLRDRGLSQTMTLLIWGIICLGLFLSQESLGAPTRLNRARVFGISYISELEKSIFRFTNEMRRKHSLAPLGWDRSLCAVARAHSADMLQRGYFSHVDPEGRTPRDRVQKGFSHPFSLAGENIWSGSGQEPGNLPLLAKIIVENWISSPGHRQNLLNPEYTHVGVGVASQGQELRVTQVLVRSGR
jgi:uncharacterized protein YkwD